jgi:hypothetical protein
MNCTPLQWRPLPPAEGGRPDGRWGHSLTLVADRWLVTIGGLQMGRTLNDTWVFNIEQFKWSRW